MWRSARISVARDRRLLDGAPLRSFMGTSRSAAHVDGEVARRIKTTFGDEDNQERMDVC
jgi:hypothetical protein